MTTISKPSPSESCCWPYCRAERHPAPDAPPMCLNHIIKVAAWGASAARAITSADMMTLVERQLASPRPALPDTSVVYYVRLGEYIKIGTTTNLAGRMSSLYVDHVPDALLATEPGDRSVENARHGQFWNERVYANRELFRPSRALMDHIEALKCAAA